MIKKLLYIAMLAGCMACVQKKTEATPEMKEVEVKDSTIYGLCGTGTMMNTIQLITSMNDTLSISLNAEDTSAPTVVAGGMMSGDRMAVTAHAYEGEMFADRVINITSLLGRWIGLDRSFEIQEDGAVRSLHKMEKPGWSEWRILNGQLLMNRDTFDIITIGADTLELESERGIYVYERVGELL